LVGELGGKGKTWSAAIWAAPLKLLLGLLLLTVL
jgi:hypothetical protein